jgi:antirestriction protein ArdC
MTTETKPTIAEAVAAAAQQLVDALKAGKSEVLTNYLSAMARFRTYSFHNSMLIFFQNPSATRVAGFNTWKKLGRSVKKGQHGIQIMAPCIRNKKSEEAAPVAADAIRRDSMYFRPVYVFSEEQTDGAEIPDLRNEQVEGDVSGHFERLVKHVADSGIALEYEAVMNGDGSSAGGKITLRSGMPAAETFSVLVHELAHERLHRSDRRKETTVRVRETEAEAVAFVVCSALGLSTNGAAANYIGLYNGDADLLISSLALIQQTAAAILVAIAPASKQQSSYVDSQEPIELPLAA